MDDFRYSYEAMLWLLNMIKSSVIRREDMQIYPESVQTFGSVEGDTLNRVPGVLHCCRLYISLPVLLRICRRTMRNS